MKVRTKGIGHRLLYAVRRIDDNACGMVVVFRDAAGASYGAVVSVYALSIVRSCRTIKVIGRRIAYRRASIARLLHVPDADIFSPGIRVLDPCTGLGHVIAHVELCPLRHLRELHPDERLLAFVVAPRVNFGGEVITILIKECQIATATRIRHVGILKTVKC